MSHDSLPATQEERERLWDIAGMLEFQAKMALDSGKINVEIDAKTTVPKIVAAMRAASGTESLPSAEAVASRDELDGSWSKHDPRSIFVDGAKWWQYHHSGATAFASEVDEMEREANKRYTLPSTARASSRETPLNCDRDPARWAREFMAAFKDHPQDAPELDEGWLIGWFANAMMCGEDTYRWKLEKEGRIVPSSKECSEPVAWTDPNQPFNLIDAATKRKWQENGWHKEVLTRYTVPLYTHPSAVEQANAAPQADQVNGIASREKPADSSAVAAPVVPSTGGMPSWVDEELKDGDRLCEAAGVLRTEGGRLPVQKIINAIQGRPVPPHRSGGARVPEDTPKPSFTHSSIGENVLWHARNVVREYEAESPRGKKTRYTHLSLAYELATALLAQSASGDASDAARFRWWLGHWAANTDGDLDIINDALRHAYTEEQIKAAIDHALAAEECAKQQSSSMPPSSTGEQIK